MAMPAPIEPDHRIQLPADWAEELAQMRKWLQREERCPPLHACSFRVWWACDFQGTMG